MPRYWMPGYDGYHYCWADSAWQAQEGMNALFALMDLKPRHTQGIVLAISQKPYPYNDQAEPDFRTVPEPLPKEVTNV